MTTSNVLFTSKKCGISLFTRHTVAEDTFVSAESLHKDIPDTNKESKLWKVESKLSQKYIDKLWHNLNIN